jgi:large subunit ribosomal protein L20
MSYSQLTGALHKAGIEMNRKVLADLAVNNPEAFKAIVDKVK